MKPIFPVFCFLYIFCISHTLSQPSPVRFGKIDTAELKMKKYNLDTTAQAVILCDFGSFNAEHLIFTRHFRLKVFKKDAASFLHEFVFVPGTSEQIKGCTYNWVNGEVVETKLRNESIFKENIRDNYFRYRVTMPDVMDGSIVELVFSFRGLPSVWHFQDILPVKWSELRIPNSRYFTFNKIFFGFQPLLINESGRWVGKDMPALSEEPYTSSIDNFVTKMEIELAQVNIGAQVNEYFATTWESANGYLLSHDFFGRQIHGSGIIISDDAKEINKKNLSGEQKMASAYELIKSRLKWNDQPSLLTTRDLSYAYKHESGNSADINLALIKLLKQLGFEAYPVAISTRENGIISPAFPTINKLNYVIAYVLSDGKSYLLDATEKNLPFGMLPERCLNGRGRIIDEVKSEWIDISALKEDRKLIYSKFEIDESGLIKGASNETFYDYAALNFRNDYMKFANQNEYITKFESENPGVIMKSISIRNLDSLNLPLKADLEISLNDQAEKMGDLIGFNPFLLERIKDSPFKNETRKYPVDYSFCKDYKYVHIFQLPDGYEIAEIPSAITIMLPEKKARFNYNITVNGNTVQLNSQFEINSVIFTETEYQLLRAFYTQVIAKEAEYIMLKKKI